MDAKPKVAMDNSEEIIIEKIKLPNGEPSTRSWRKGRILRHREVLPLAMNLLA